MNQEQDDQRRSLLDQLRDQHANTHPCVVYQIYDEMCGAAPEEVSEAVRLLRHRIDQVRIGQALEDIDILLFSDFPKPEHTSVILFTALIEMTEHLHNMAEMPRRAAVIDRYGRWFRDHHLVSPLCWVYYGLRWRPEADALTALRSFEWRSNGSGEYPSSMKPEVDAFFALFTWRYLPRLAREGSLDVATFTRCFPSHLVDSNVGLCAAQIIMESNMVSRVLVQNRLVPRTRGITEVLPGEEV